MSMRSRKLKLAPSFIVSLALLPACGSGAGDPREGGDCRPPECHMNPPPPPPPTADPTADPTAAETGAAKPPPAHSNPPPTVPPQ